MRVTEIKRAMSFGEHGSMEMSMLLDEGDDPLIVIEMLENMMSEGVERYIRRMSRICRVCGDTYDIVYASGRRWAEPDLCSDCANKIDAQPGDLESAVEVEMLSDQVIEELERCRGLLANEAAVNVEFGRSVSVDSLRAAIAQGERALGNDSDDDQELKLVLSQALESLKACGSSKQLAIDTEKVFSELVQQLKRCEKLMEMYENSPEWQLAATSVRQEISAAKVALQENDQVKMTKALEALKGCE